MLSFLSLARQNALRPSKTHAGTALCATRSSTSAVSENTSTRVRGIGQHSSQQTGVSYLQKLRTGGSSMEHEGQSIVIVIVVRPPCRTLRVPCGKKGEHPAPLLSRSPESRNSFVCTFFPPSLAAAPWNRLPRFDGAWTYRRKAHRTSIGDSG